MTTAEALERIGDAGSFEILAMRVLRHLHPDCECLEHLGVNAQGKTIPGPIDGFGRVPGTAPSTFVTAAFTAAAREELRRKWYGATRPLSDLTRHEAGDLVKACIKANRMRLTEPASTFTVFLCTNQRLDEALMDEGYAIGNKHSVEVVFVGQSCLRDFLDSAEGQPLREEFLHIRAVSLSQELLQQLSRSSLVEYRIEWLPSVGLVETGTWGNARRALTLCAPLLALVGKAGVGKSIIARSLLESHIENGGIGLWIPGDFLQDARSLAEAVTLTLRQLNPYLGGDAGHEALRIVPPDRPLVLVLDDPNRTDQPGTVLRKIFGWAKNLSSKPTESRPNIKLVVPIRESQFSNFGDDFEKESWLTVLTVGAMHRAESIACLRNRLGDQTLISDPELHDIAERLRDDPILLTIFARLAPVDPAVNVIATLDDVIGNFVNRSLGELVSTTGKLKASYELALAELTRQMIVNKRMHPEWHEVSNWLSPDAVRSLEDIAGRGDVCHIANQGKRDVFEFRHDRILEWQLSETIAREFRMAQPDYESVFDPYMVQALGRALASGAGGDSALEIAYERVPVSFVAALDFIRQGNGVSAGRICSRASKWLKSLDHALPSVKDDALSILQNIQSEHVLRVAEDLSPSRPILFARLRNGDAASGAAALSRHFYPRTNFSWLENLIAQASARYGTKLVHQVAHILQDCGTSEEVRRGAFVLAGYLGSTDLAESIANAWRLSPARDESIAPALWAALRCSDASGNPLATILPGIFSVSDERGIGGQTPRNQLFEDIGFSARHGITPEVLAFLKDLSERDERYGSFVFSLFARIDKPLCLEFVIRKVAKHAAKPVAPGHVSGVFIWESQWRRGSAFEDAPLPADCVDELWRLCRPDNPEWLRTYAFKWWVRYSGDKLWSTEIPADLFGLETAVWELAKRGDRRVTDRLAKKLRDDPNLFYNGLRGMWSNSLEPILDNALKIGHPAAIHALRDAPSDSAERLIMKNWEVIHQRPNGIAAALYLGTRATLALAKSALQSDPEPAKSLQHAGDYFGFNLHGYSDKITPQHLEAVRPFLQYFDDHDLADVAEFCRRKAHIEWAQDNVIAVCRRRLAEGDHGYLARIIRRSFPYDEELMADLDRMAASDEHHVDFNISFWAGAFNERLDDPERMPRVLNQWLQRELSVAKFKVAALALRYHGSRRSLQVLKQFSSSPDWPSMVVLYQDAEYAVMRRSLV